MRTLDLKSDVRGKLAQESCPAYLFLHISDISALPIETTIYINTPAAKILKRRNWNKADKAAILKGVQEALH